MFDKVIVDHQEKTIQVYDLKCTWSVENFLEEYYLYRRAYIQAYLYYWATKQHFAELCAQGYLVEEPKFIVCDSTNYYNPLIYTLDASDLDKAEKGFTYKNREYKGVKTIIEDLKWAMENNVWNISRENSLNNGLVNIMGWK